MMWTLLIDGALAGAIGGVGLGFVGEFDTQGSELLVNLSGSPLRGDIGVADVSLLESSLSWGVLPKTKRFDRIQISGLASEQVFGSDAVARWWLGELRYEQDFRYVELGLLGGSVALPLGNSGLPLELTLGGDLRLRDLSEVFGEDLALYLGVPLGLRLHQDLPWQYWSVRGALTIRPALAMLGNTPLAVESHLVGAMVYSAIGEEAFRLDLYVESSTYFDSYTGVDLALEERLMLGAQARF